MFIGKMLPKATLHALNMASIGEDLLNTGNDLKTFRFRIADIK